MSSIDIPFERSIGEAPRPNTLMVIDDHRVRMELFSATSSILKKIRKLETDHEAFHSVDLHLYESWHSLTFRQELQETERIERRYRTLTTFRTHLVYLAETSKISFAEAYRLLKEEELQYQNGDEDWKFIIEKLRQHRLEYAKKVREKQNAPLFESVAAPLSEDPPSSAQPDLSRLRRKSRSLYYYCKEVNDETFKKILSEKKTGYVLFKEVFQIIMDCGDWNLLARLWKNGLDAHKNRMLRSMPSHLVDFINQMVTEAGSDGSWNRKAEAVEVELKSVFRRLVRVLHPDMCKNNEIEDFRNWSAKVFQQAQKAAAARDLQGLKRLEFMTVVQLGDLNKLTLDEIYESSLIFAEELEKLKVSLKTYEKHPAWRFSSRRSYQKLASKIRSEMKKDIAPRSFELELLEEWLAKLEGKNPDN